MDAARFPRFRLPLTLAISLAYSTLLLWQYLHDGVPAHSFLARDDMPVISNWWGALVLPALTWFLSGRLQSRLQSVRPDTARADATLRSAMLAFGGALVYGAILAVAFATDHAEVSSLLFQALLLLALLLPLYRAEYVLGFVLGLTLTFGAVLPTFISTVVAAVSGVLHLTVRRAVARFRAA